MQLNFAVVTTAAKRFAAAGDAVSKLQSTLSVAPKPSYSALNTALRDAETALLNDAGLPKRPWYRHTIYAPGEFTGYAAVVIPGVNEGIDAADTARTQGQIDALASALNHASGILENAAK